MEGNNMKHIEGPSWKTFVRFSTFEEADTKRKELLETEEDLQVKVHWLRGAVHKVFAVKTRLDPAKAPPPARKKNKKGKKR
jgi:hypothetical protein